MPNDCDLVNRVGALLSDDDFSDVTLIVEDESLPAHKAILASSSDYFRALLWGNVYEGNQVHLRETPLRGFKLVLKYIYKGIFDPEDPIEDGAILEVLELANLYGLDKLNESVCSRLDKFLSAQNVCVFYDRIHMLQLEQPMENCRRRLDAAAEEVLKSESFCQLSSTALHRIISRDTFCVDEIEIFKAVERWAEANPNNSGLSKVLEAIRLPLIQTADLLTTVRNSRLITMECLLGAIESRELNPAGRNFRGMLLKDVNLATREHGAFLVTKKAKVGRLTLPQNCMDYEMIEMPSDTSKLKFIPATGSTLALGKPYTVNFIMFSLRQTVDIPDFYSFSVEVSMDLENWHQIIEDSDDSNLRYRAFVFPPRASRYIRIIQTRRENQELTRLCAFTVQYIKCWRNYVSAESGPFETSRDAPWIA